MSPDLRVDPPDSHAPYAAALRDYFDGDCEATILLRSDRGEEDLIPMEIFFRTPDAFFPFEEAALRLCRGSVLDLGAGTGVHSLVLQERGHDVTAVELLPTAAEIMRERGIERVVVADFLSKALPPADTVLMTMNGPGPARTVPGLEAFLKRAHELVQPGGQLLLDSGAVTEARMDPALDWPPRETDYIGENWISLEYEGQRGRPFQELYVDYATLVAVAGRAGWRCEPFYQDGDGGYGVRLTVALSEKTRRGDRANAAERGRRPTASASSSE